MSQSLRDQQSFSVKRTFARHFWGRWLLHLVDFKESR
ncbi:hypothetical protein Golob_006959 [Gossypium lobatum]|uniref:Uncharacterized protein n=1 Tax=Gossypium lobatum TaxID=34289 RepID=A0A7J8NEW4_9ROSI|nr:hypothetical protein [Gossypium lobatum]